MGDDCLDHLLQCPAAVREPDTPCPRHTGELLIGQVRQQADRGLASAHPIQNLRRSGGRLGTLVAMGVPTTISRRPSARAIPGGLQEPAQEVIALGHVYSERADGVSGTVVGTRLAQIRPLRLATTSAISSSCRLAVVISSMPRSLITRSLQDIVSMVVAMLSLYRAKCIID